MKYNFLTDFSAFIFWTSLSVIPSYTSMKFQQIVNNMYVEGTVSFFILGPSFYFVTKR